MPGKLKLHINQNWREGVARGSRARLFAKRAKQSRREKRRVRRNGKEWKEGGK